MQQKTELAQLFKLSRSVILHAFHAFLVSLFHESFVVQDLLFSHSPAFQELEAELAMLLCVHLSSTIAFPSHAGLYLTVTDSDVCLGQ